MVNENTIFLNIVSIISTIFIAIIFIAHVNIARAAFSHALSLGTSGTEVKELQEFLKLTPDIYPEGIVSGYFGLLTEKALKKFQLKYGIEPLGIVGPKTRAKLNELSLLKNTGAYNPVLNIQTSFAKEIYGLWRLENLYKKFNMEEWKILARTRTPTPIRYMEFISQGMCAEYRNIPEGGVDGFYCGRYQPASTNGNKIVLYPDFGKDLINSQKIVNISIGVEGQGSLSSENVPSEGFAYWVPTRWNINNGKLELLSEDGKNKYVFIKLERSQPPQGNFILTIDNPVVEKGTDLIIRGSVQTEEIIYLYINRKSQNQFDKSYLQTGVPRFGFGLKSGFDKCTAPECDSLPVVEIGTLIEPVPAKNGIGAGFTYPPTECPWHPGQYKNTLQIYVDILCIKPSPDGKFVVKIFNPGNGANMSSDIKPTLPAPVVIHAKLAKSGMEARAEANFLLENSICSKPQPPNYARVPNVCPPFWNQRKRGENLFSLNEVMLNIPMGTLTNRPTLYVDLKINGSDGPIKLRRQEMEFTATWKAGGVKYCSLTGTMAGELYWDWKPIEISDNKKIYFRPPRNSTPAGYNQWLDIECNNTIKAIGAAPDVRDRVLFHIE